jgi:hypothetical protein
VRFFSLIRGGRSVWSGLLGLSVAVLVTVASGASPASDVPLRPLENSDLVAKAPDGTLAIAQKNGKPIDGVKLSQHDRLILSPRVAVTADGTIHVAFTEQSEVFPFPLFVYYRQSTDGGKSWSDAKNLSEDMANVPVGECTLLADAGDRVYVIWHCGLSEGYMVTPGASENLVYRVLDHGKWSKIIPVHPPGSAATQNDGSYFSFTCTDAAGRAQVVWNTCPDRFIPDQVMAKNYAIHLAGIGNGLVFQATLDGSTASAPRQIFMAPVTQDPNPGGLGDMSKACDDLSALDGYVDAAGGAHFIAIDRGMRDPDPGSRVELIEAAKQTPAIKLPTPYMQVWPNPPKLLLDAKGRNHIIALYAAGERPAFRDYLLGSDDDPAVIMAAKAPKGTCMGFQAYQGPGGRMAVVMQTTDAGFNDRGDSWVSVSTGDKWSPPVCITNNAGRASYAAKNTGAAGSVLNAEHFGPGPGAVAFDKQGHLLLVICNVKTGSFAVSAGGVVYAGGSSASPMLFFYKF